MQLHVSRHLEGPVHEHILVTGIAIDRRNTKSSSCLSPTNRAAGHQRPASRRDLQRNGAGISRAAHQFRIDQDSRNCACTVWCSSRARSRTAIPCAEAAKFHAARPTPGDVLPRRRILRKIELDPVREPVAEIRDSVRSRFPSHSRDRPASKLSVFSGRSLGLPTKNDSFAKFSINAGSLMPRAGSSGSKFQSAGGTSPRRGE